MMSCGFMVHIGPGNGLLLDQCLLITDQVLQPVPEGDFEQKYSRYWCLKFAHLRLDPHLPGANELK